MLTQETIKIIQSTIPLLETHGRAITDTFYQMLFDDYPFLKNMFNPRNQENGEQSRALSDAVIAYAKHIDNLDVLLPAVQRIANKHVSLGVKKAHYPVVGSVLLNAIQSVLGLEDEHPALQAWGQAYGVLANVLMDTEAALIDEKRQQSGGFEGFRDFYIEKIVDEAKGVKSFYFQPFDLAPVPDFIGGQYIGVRVHPHQGAVSHIRQYSLSKIGLLRITVKAEADGAVSQYLHAASEGDAVQLQVPTGDFTYKASHKKTLFISGGVGITPLMAMAEDAMDAGGASDDLLFIQCTKNVEQQLFENDFSQWTAEKKIQHKLCLSESDQGCHQGRLDEAVLARWLDEAGFAAADTAVYFCGPKGFMANVMTLLQSLGFHSSQVHYEVFGPTEAL